MSRNEPNEYRFTIREAYKLGDAFKAENELIAAEACYAFAEMKPLPMPIPNDAAVDPNKLSELIKYIKRTNYQLPKKARGKGKDIPPDCLRLIQAFYDPWLQQIKPDMKERSDEHAQRRMKGVIEVFRAVTGDRLGQLILDDIAKANHNQQIDKIDAWNGPSFGKFQIRDNQKMKNNFSLSRLTVVLDFKNYRKRCRNSQEDWFKAIDGRFFAQCLNKAYQMFVDKFSDNKEREYIGIVFLKAVLDKYIQFPSASAKLLVPAGTIFANPELMETIHRFHPAINPLAIKQQARSRAVRILHKRLMQGVNAEYDKICGSMENPLLSLPASPALPPRVNVNMTEAQDNSSFGSEHEDEVYHEAETNDDGFLQMINSDDIEMNTINNTNTVTQNGSRPQFENNYSYNGSQSDGSSSFLHNGSSSGQSDEEDGNWRSSINVPYPVMVQFPPLTNSVNSNVVTNLLQNEPNPKITNPFDTSTTMEQQQQQQQQQQPSQQFQINQVSQLQEPAHPLLPELPANLNMTLFMNIPEKNQQIQENEKIQEQLQENVTMNVNNNNNNNGNDEVMTQINTRQGWDDGMTQIGITDMIHPNINTNQSMIPFMNDDNQTTFQPMMDLSQTQTQTQTQTVSCPSQCTCHFNDNHDQTYHHQNSLPPIPSQMSQMTQMSQIQIPSQHNTINCDYEYSVPAQNPQFNTMTSSVISGDTHSVGTGIGSRYSSVAPGFMNSNAPYKTIQIQQQPQSHTQYVTSTHSVSMQPYSSRGSSPTTDYGYTPSHDMNIPNDIINNNPFQDSASTSNNMNIPMMNAFDDTFEIEDPNPVTMNNMTKDMCMGCYESVSQCKCNSISMNRRYKPQFQNSNTFNTRNNRIHHQNMQSMVNVSNNNRKHRRSLHIEQLNNIRIREANNNQIYNNYNNNYDNYNNNNWNTSMTMGTY